MTRLFLVRHGLTEWNTLRRFAGHTDLALSPEGNIQAERLRARLAGEQIDAAYCSDLQRAVATAKIVTSGHEVELTLNPDLRELNYGQAEGLTFDEIQAKFPELAKMIRRFSPELAFPDGESFDGMTERVKKFINRLDEHDQDETVLIVSHGGALRTLLCELLEISQQNWRKFRIDNTSLTIIDRYPQRVILSLLNDVSHLNESGEG